MTVEGSQDHWSTESLEETVGRRRTGEERRRGTGSSKTSHCRGDPPKGKTGLVSKRWSSKVAKSTGKTNLLLSKVLGYSEEDPLTERKGPCPRDSSVLVYSFLEAAPGIS